MKRVIVTGLAAVFVIGLVGVAAARGGGYGMGMGMGPGMGMGMGQRGGGPCMQQGAASPTAAAIDETKAKAIATDYVAKSLPGYQVEKLVKFDRPRGAMYQVEVKGPKGEIQYLHINPWGQVRAMGAGRVF